MCLVLPASGLWLRYAALQNLIPSFPWIAPPRPPPWRNPRKGRDHILPYGNLEVERLRDLAAVGGALRLRVKAGPTGRRAEGIPGTQFNAVIKYH